MQTNVSRHPNRHSIPCKHAFAKFKVLRANPACTYSQSGLRLYFKPHLLHCGAITTLADGSACLLLERVQVAAQVIRAHNIFRSRSHGSYPVWRRGHPAIRKADESVVEHGGQGTVYLYWSCRQVAVFESMVLGASDNCACDRRTSSSLDSNANCAVLRSCAGPYARGCSRGNWIQRKTSRLASLTSDMGSNHPQLH